MKPHIIVISGPGGVGKNTIASRLIAANPLEFVAITKLTTRAIRPGEQAGNEFHFLTIPEFENRQTNHELLESNNFNGQWYGVPRLPVDTALTQGKSPVLVIDVNGARAIRTHYGRQAYLIFITAPVADLKQRYVSRGQSLKEAQRRIDIAMKDELPEQYWYDCVIANPDGQLDRVVQTIADQIHSL